MPHSESLLNNFFAQQAKTDALMAALQGIASGKLNAGAIGVPAIWWSRAAAAARSLNDEQQAAVELLRFSSVTDDSPLLAIAIATLDACDTTVFECMRRAMACESKVVSFEKLSRDSTPLDLALVGGLRGAARMALAKSIAESPMNCAANLIWPLRQFPAVTRLGFARRTRNCARSWRKICDGTSDALMT